MLHINCWYYMQCKVIQGILHDGEIVNEKKTKTYTAFFLVYIYLCAKPNDCFYG